MSAEEIGQAVLSLADEATITSLLDWLEYFGRSEERLERYPEKQRHTQACMLLASEDAIPDLTESFKDMERLKNRNDEIAECYSSIRSLLDSTHAYLQNKKTKLTHLQSKARDVILELRNGCPLCGLLDGAHTQQCARLT